MIRAEDLANRLNARRVRDGEYRAACPVHGGRSKTSLSITDARDRLLIHCHAGCDFASILNALGITVADVFKDGRPDPRAKLNGLAKAGLQKWCERRLVGICGELRHIEQRIQTVARELSEYEIGTRPPAARQEELWSQLQNAYRKRTELEAEFEVLQGHNDQSKLELWRARA